MTPKEIATKFVEASDAFLGIVGQSIANDLIDLTKVRYMYLLEIKHDCMNGTHT